MTDSLRVPCSCGCENWVPADRARERVTCTVCGNPLVIAAAARPDVSLPVDEGPSVVDRLEEVRLRENRARSVFAEGESIRDGWMDETCSRCGRELRGEWDRVESGGKIVCYVCSNQVVEGIPERVQARFVPGDEARRGPASAPDSMLPPSWRSPRRTRSQSWTIKAAVIVLGFTFFGLAAYYAIFGESDGSIVVSNSESRAKIKMAPNAWDLQQLSTGMWVLVRGWMVLSSVLPAFIALFLVQVLNNSLPGRRFLGYVAPVALACTPLLAVQIGGLVAEHILWSKPVLLLFVSLILGLVELLVLVTLFFDELDESFSQAVSFVVALLAFNFFAVPYLNFAIFTGLGVI